jgi:hypothetical protein
MRPAHISGAKRSVGSSRIMALRHIVQFILGAAQAAGGDRSSGFQMWVRRSTRVMRARFWRPRLSSSLVANSSPAAPPPTMTMWRGELSIM